LLTPAEEFIDALAQGDNAAASAVLRDMKILRGGALELMAELLQDDPDSSFPSRLCLGGLAGLFLLPCLGGFAFVRLFSMVVREVSRS
jgi:hypothetical protein